MMLYNPGVLLIFLSYIDHVILILQAFIFGINIILPLSTFGFHWWLASVTYISGFEWLLKKFSAKSKQYIGIQVSYIAWRVYITKLIFF